MKSVPTLAMVFLVVACSSPTPNVPEPLLGARPGNDAGPQDAPHCGAPPFEWLNDGSVGQVVDRQEMERYSAPRVALLATLGGLRLRPPALSGAAGCP
jgi:hypothetical protein